MNFWMKVMNILETKTNDLTDKGKVQVIKNWMGWESMQPLKTFTNEEKEKCKIVKGLSIAQ